jgi:prepilin-type N-terminal cleavage/methylation domain-containing protein
MSCCKRSVERRAFTLIELMVSQAIALIVLSALLSFVSMIVNKVQSQTAAADAQARLRQTSQLLLRDTQGVGSSSGIGVGDFYFVNDGGTSGADEFTIFKRDEAVCGGNLAISFAGTVGTFERIDVDPTAATNLQCPVGRAGCTVVDVQAAATLLSGVTTSVAMLGATADASNCRIGLPVGAQAANAVSTYNMRFGRTAPSLSAVITEVVPRQAMLGTSLSYRVVANKLQRSTNGGATWVDVLDNVLDLQVERVYAVGTTQVAVTATTGTPLPDGVTEDNFLGLRLGLISFAVSPDGTSTPPPAAFSNRTHNTTTPSRRHRASFVFSASRNRTGA